MARDKKSWMVFGMGLLDGHEIYRKQTQCESKAVGRPLIGYVLGSKIIMHESCKKANKVTFKVYAGFRG